MNGLRDTERKCVRFCSPKQARHIQQHRGFWFQFRGRPQSMCSCTWSVHRSRQASVCEVSAYVVEKSTERWPNSEHGSIYVRDFWNNASEIWATNTLQTHRTPRGDLRLWRDKGGKECGSRSKMITSVGEGPTPRRGFSFWQKFRFQRIYQSRIKAICRRNSDYIGKWRLCRRLCSCHRDTLGLSEAFSPHLWDSNRGINTTKSA